MSVPFTYRDLKAWQLAIAVVEQVYRMTGSFPRSELYGLTGQLRRAAVSIPSNLAEGHCRRTTRAFANHVSIALGSHGELETCIEIAARLGYLPAADKTAMLMRTAPVGRMLNRLHQALERKVNSDPLGEASHARSL